MLFDANWEVINHCSYWQLTIPGCKHSGDWTSAPYPRGAREAVDVDFAELTQAYPTCTYLAVMVYSFSGTKFVVSPLYLFFIFNHPTQHGRSVRCLRIRLQPASYWQGSRPERGHFRG